MCIRFLYLFSNLSVITMKNLYQSSKSFKNITSYPLKVLFSVSAPAQHSSLSPAMNGISPIADYNKNNTNSCQATNIVEKENGHVWMNIHNPISSTWYEYHLSINLYKCVFSQHKYSVCELQSATQPAVITWVLYLLLYFYYYWVWL